MESWEQLWSVGERIGEVMRADSLPFERDIPLDLRIALCGFLNIAHNASYLRMAEAFHEFKGC